MRIGKIFENVPSFWKCKDGALSTHDGRGACNSHGGLSSAKPIKLRRRCKNIAVVTPARQIDLFRKETQGDLFAPPIIPTKTKKPRATATKTQIKDEDLIFIALNIPCDSDLTGGLVQVLERKYNAKAQKKAALRDRINKFVKAVEVGQGHRTAILKKYVLKDEFSTHYPILKQLSDEKLNDCFLKIKEASGVFFQNMENSGHQSKTLIQPTEGKNTEGKNTEGKTPSAAEPQQNKHSSIFFDMPLRQIETAESLFQNRGHAYSIRSVDNIVNAVLNKTFTWANFDPITLWLNPSDRKYYILSGHSRFEAFKRLSKLEQDNEESISVSKFQTIPAKIERGLTLEQAKEIALNSNTLSTKETDIERAEYYRNLRNTGLKKAEIEKLATRNEGRNASTIVAFSFLYTNGKALNALTLLDGSSGANQQNARILAKWIGEARQRFTILTDAHENEIYDWLLSSEGYGRSKGQMSKETDFLQRLGNLLQKKGFGGMFNSFDASKPLNIKSLQYKSPIERDYDEQLNDLKREITDLEKELNEKRRDLSRRGGTVEEIERITAGTSATIARKQRQYFDLLAAKGKMIEAAQSQQSLFMNGLRGIQRRNFDFRRL